MSTELLSKESVRFIENLRLYLFASGKKTEEIDDIVEELKGHLLEAEKSGKNIHQVVGDSPEEYMQMISKEMKVDIRSWMMYLPLILIGGISFSIFGNLLEGSSFTLNYSLMQIIGIVLHGIFFLTGTVIAFRYVSRKQTLGVKQYVIITVPVILSMLFYIAVLFINHIYPSPMYHFSLTTSLIVASLAAIVVIGLSIWAKTAILPFVLVALHLPSYLLMYTNISEDNRLIFGMLISYLLIGVYFFFEFRRMKDDTKE
ncbi:hypothetical protein [Oceanobacillus iheyensis HTE831]|uniref:HAAS transmembrane region domain-containing protein n=1 Tax=Oceanobacillus iheyensis (strain DSM 14371 / CIP 107618 / JCM 11309 / KCTC 3954 / HTE831) TaxID=221109 RepID=Q8ESQ3_OCEIH|nr:DUF1129 domain-containing protein [Oceanobacillus iheyensis]BAC12524.1 hypothetical protein [Oceanobacillus iheyensis HTE831]